jgi:dCMP deaminase
MIPMPRSSRDQYSLRMAALVATRSTCVRRAAGCILIDSRGMVLATGHNGVPANQPHCTDAPCPGANAPSGRSLELCEAIHAEQNALMFCADITRIATVYVTCGCCVFCTRMLLNTACERIVFPVEYSHPHAAELWIRAGRKWDLVPILEGT